MPKPRALTAAAFLMAVSAIGPGFLTQTTVFTSELRETLAFAILLSILIDIGAQLNTWRVICISGKRGHELADALLPGLGLLVSTVILFGSFVFNIGNTIGCAIGLEELLGWPRWLGATVSAALAVGLFLLPTMLAGMDWFSKILGVGMILMMAYIVFATAPPLADAARAAILPASFPETAIVTLVGGTIGGYIMFSGAHRLLDAGIQGQTQVKEITWASIQGILVTGLMRTLLFLAVLGVVAGGVVLSGQRAVFQAFEAKAGQLGFILACLIFWSAAITSVVGCSYTAITFVGHQSASVTSRLIVAFIAATWLVTLALDFSGVSPQGLLIFAGALNGVLLPIVLAVVLLAAYSARLMGAYRHPWWAGLAGGLAWLMAVFFGVQTVARALDL